MNRKQLEKHIAKTYDVYPDYPWEDHPDFAVFRHKDNKKWFALVMNISKEKLGLQSNDCIDVVNLKCDPIIAGSLRMEQGFFSAYHMNKTNWITASLNGDIPNEKLIALVDMSFAATEDKKAYNKKQKG